MPRHPERFDEVDRLLQDYSKNRGLKYQTISKSDKLDSDIVLCDKMGELVNLYAISDIVLLGGSFAKGIGGHNPIEPAYFGNKIISGEHYFNQKPLYEMVENILVCKADKIQENLDILKSSKIKNQIDIEKIIKEIKDGKSV